MYILLENFNAKKFGINKDVDSNNNFQQFELNYENLQDQNYYQDLVKVSQLVLSDKPISSEFFVNQNEPIIVSFKLNDGVMISKYFKANENHQTWSSKLGYLYNTFEDQDFKGEFLEELKIVFNVDNKGYNNFVKNSK